LFLNAGYESVDAAVVMCRKWGYREKKIPENQAKILFCTGCYWGLMTAARTGCNDPLRRNNFGPFPSRESGFEFVDFGNAEKLEEKLKNDSNIAAFFFEPI
jgi:ornithine--oxo-acid transaminase